jgi:S-adenosylmethionine-diacylglycerol 3-amino-3-carboxypropyl transferase
MAYFDKLNYTLSNEDTRIEFELLKPGARHVFSIAGSGARVLPLIARNPEELTVVDVSENQLYLTELRLAAARHLSHPEYLYFMGYRGGLFSMDNASDDRMRIFETLDLSEKCREFWLRNAGQWTPRGFVYLGSWEGHFIKISRLFRSILRMDVLPIFEAHSLKEQRRLIEKHWKPKLFRNFLRVAASEFVFNRFLYKGHFSGGSDRRTEELAPWRFLEQEFNRLFQTTLLRKNYMMQLLFLGKVVFEEGLPLEAQPDTLELIKASKTRVHYLHSDLVSALGSKGFDFVSLSDTISYLPDDVANTILGRLPAESPSGTKMIIRSFLRAPTAMETSHWKHEAELEQWAHALDGTGIYQFHIFTKE